MRSEDIPFGANLSEVLRRELNLGEQAFDATWDESIRTENGDQIELEYVHEVGQDGESGSWFNGEWSTNGGTADIHAGAPTALAFGQRARGRRRCG